MIPIFYETHRCVICKKEMTREYYTEPHDPELVVLELLEGQRFGPVLHDSVDWEVKRSRAILCPTCAVPLIDYLKEKGVLQ